MKRWAKETHHPPRDAFEMTRGRVLHGETATQATDCRDCAHGAAGLCRLVREAAVEGVRPARMRRFARDEIVVAEGEEFGFLGVLRRGYLRREKLKASGRRMIMDLGYPGDLIGGLHRQPLPFTLETATDVEICVLDRTSVERMLSASRPFQRYIAAELGQRHARLLDMIWQRGVLTSRERIIAFLVTATRVMPTVPQPDGSTIVTIEIARRDWADLTNTAVETISRTMSHLAERGLVTCLAPTRYLVRDVDRLARLAGIDPPAPGVVSALPRADAARGGDARLRVPEHVAEPLDTVAAVGGRARAKPV